MFQRNRQGQGRGRDGRGGGSTRRLPWYVWLVLALAGVGASIYRDSFQQGSNTKGGPGSITARASVSDGDSLRIGQMRLRLVDIDAPELDQCCRDGGARMIRCGEISKAHLAGLIGRDEVSCTWRESDPNNRPLATCRAGGVNLNARMVEDGYAILYHRKAGASGWRASQVYASEAARARAERRGLHGYQAVEPPHVLRANQRTGVRPQLSGC